MYGVEKYGAGRFLQVTKVTFSNAILKMRISSTIVDSLMAGSAGLLETNVAKTSIISTIVMHSDAKSSG